MKRVRNSARVLALALVLCMMMTMGVFAANGSVWITETDTDDGTVAFIVTDTTVTDGVVAVNYDASKLTYQSVTVNESCVAMHAVNADEAGVVLISWVAPEAFVPQGNELLIQVNFAGTSDKDVTLEGDITGADITEAPADVDKLALLKTIWQAQALDEEDYTAESWADLEEALAAAEAVYADPAATQEEVDAATAALQAAIDALELADVPAGDVDKRELKKAIILAEGLNKGNYTEYSWNALVEALEEAKEVYGDADATQAEVDAATAALKAAIAGLKVKGVETGDNADLVLPIVLAVVSVVAIAGVLFVMNKKNKGGKAA